MQIGAPSSRFHHERIRSLATAPLFHQHGLFLFTFFFVQNKQHALCSSRTSVCACAHDVAIYLRV
jgi:hypothetical protein